MIATHIDTCQNNLLEAMIDDLSNVVVDVFVAATCGSASHHRYDAVRAEVVTSVVNLYQAACVKSVECRLIAEKVDV